MATFGHYETVCELHRTGVTVVYSGQTAARPGEKFVIKVFQPLILLSEGEQAKAESDLFLNSARIQQKVAGSGAQHWAPVYECGSTTDGTFYATDNYDRSLQQLIDGRIRLTAEALHAIIESVAKGLIELKQVCSQPDGNLKATNVLIVGEQDISCSQIVLSDPLPDERIDKHHWTEDLRAIGELIYQLVIHRPSPTMGGWQVPDSEEWARLGKQANDWRDLCNRLLNANAEPGMMTIESLIEELDQLKKAKPVLLHRWPIVAGLVGIACAVILYILWPSPPPPEKTEWKNLCMEYLGWVEALDEDLKLPKDNPLKNRWSKDRHLEKILKKIKDASYPDKVVPTGKILRDIIDVDVPKLEELKVKAGKTKDALEAIEYIKSFFDPSSDKPWPLLASIAGTAKNLEAHGRKPSKYLNSLVTSVKPGPDKRIAENIDEVLELDQKGTLKKIDSCLQKIDGCQETIESLDDPILAKFGDYIQSELASDEGQGAQDDLEATHSKLEQISSLANKLAEFIKGDWQTKVGQKAFVNDHGDDSAKTLTSKTFNERLDLIKRYYYLRPDPRDKFFELVSQTEGNIKAAGGPNPQAAGECAKSLAQLRLNIEGIQDFKGIEKYRDKINEKINDLQPKIVEINKIAISLIESPEDWLQRINEDSSIAASEAINEKWIVLRDKALKGHTPDGLNRNNELYQDLRQRVKDTKENLVKLDQELRRELPSQVDAELKETGWNNKLKQLYDEERRETIKRIVGNIPLQNELPSINDLSFEEFRRTQFSKFEQRRDDLGGILAAFNEIEGGLDACYLLDDELPQNAENVRKLYDKWKDTDILKEPKINGALADLTERVKKLIDIEKSDNRQQLANIALDSGSQTEAAYTAWIRLGKLSGPPWPNEREDLKADHEIQAILKTKFETIKHKDGKRGDLLLQILDNTRVEHEIVFKEANIGRYKDTIAENSSAEDKILTKFAEFATDNVSNIKIQHQNRREALTELENLEALAEKLAVFVSGQDWQSDKIHKVLFRAEFKIPKSYTIQTFKDWLEEVNGYRKLESDPREEHPWDEKINDIEGLIVQVGRSRADRAQEFSGELDAYKPELKQIRAFPAVEKNRNRIYGAVDQLNRLWENLEVLEKNVRSVLKPEWCEHIIIGENRMVEFESDNLRKLLEPIDASNMEPMVVSQHDYRELPREDFVEHRNNNLGWPKYVRSKRDPSVILGFIPGDDRRAIEPFYMAIRETTNAQYRLFLESEARSFPGLPKKWSYFADKKSDKAYIQSNPLDYPHSGIKWDDKEGNFVLGQWDDKGEAILRDEAEPDAPVTWVTFDGAKSYAEWLGAQLPKASQHQYACKADADTTYPWGNDLRYAHVRATAWKHAASKYNLDTSMNYPARPPLPNRTKGKFSKQLNPSDIVHEEDRYKSVWPTNTKPNTRPNDWGLYDMIGNVWEWCDDEDGAQPVICGGSCLTPPEDIRLESNYKKTFTGGVDCDVGFRLIFPARL